MPDVNSLRADLPAFVLGILVMAVGLGSLALAIARRSGRDLLLVFVVNDNLGALGVPTIRGVEAYGFVAFVAALGYVAVSRVFADERRLLALSQELETARRIQASILPPRVPAVDGIGVAVRYEPMAAVAGDFYDFAPRPGRLGLLVATSRVTGSRPPSSPRWSRSPSRPRAATSTSRSSSFRA
jgi:hypothetical protein